MSIADEVVLVLMPGSGDSVQALKAGIMEIPDVIAINKMDQPGAKAMLNDIRSVISLDPEAARAPRSSSPRRFAKRASTRSGGRSSSGARARGRRGARGAAPPQSRRGGCRGSCRARPHPDRGADRSRSCPHRRSSRVQDRELDPLTAVDAIVTACCRSPRDDAADARRHPDSAGAPRRHCAGDPGPHLRNAQRPRRAPVSLKAENLQLTGSFKIRGAYNTIAQLTEAEREAGVVTASAGNHGQAVAWAARQAGIAATIFVPDGAPMAKFDAAVGYGATVDQRRRRIRRGRRRRAPACRGDGRHVRSCLRRPAGDRGTGHARSRAGRAAAARTGHGRDPVGGGGLASGIALALRALRPSCRSSGSRLPRARRSRGGRRSGRRSRTGSPSSIPRS